MCAIRNKGDTTEVSGRQISSKIATSIRGRSSLLLVATSITALVCAFAAQALGSLGAATNFSVGSTPYAVAIGNLNSDANSDLAVANKDSNNVSVLLDSGPTATADPASLSFAAQIKGTLGAPQTVTVSNSAEGYPLSVTGVSLAGAGSASLRIGGENCTNADLPVSGSCKVDVGFSATSTGPKSATLEISYEGLASPLVVPLSGTGGSAKSTRITCKVKRRKHANTAKVTCAVKPAGALAGKRYGWRLTKRGKVYRHGTVRARFSRATFSIPGLGKLSKGRYLLKVGGRRGKSRVIRVG